MMARLPGRAFSYNRLMIEVGGVAGGCFDSVKLGQMVAGALGLVVDTQVMNAPVVMVMVVDALVHVVLVNAQMMGCVLKVGVVLPMLVVVGVMVVNALMMMSALKVGEVLLMLVVDELVEEV